MLTTIVTVKSKHIKFKFESKIYNTLCKPLRLLIVTQKIYLKWNEKCIFKMFSEIIGHILKITIT